MFARRRILIAPRPGLHNGPSIALLRLQRALHERGLKTTALPFRLFGRSILPWDFAIVMGVPVRAANLLNGSKPVILIMGKPEDSLESGAVGRAFTSQDELDNEARAAAIVSAHRVTFISNYVTDIWRKWFLERNRSFPEKWRVVYHGLDVDQFSPRPRLSVHEPFTLGCIGAIRTLVRIDALYEVSRRLSFPHRLKIIGSMTPECEKRLAMLQSSSRWKAPLQRIPWIAADRLAEQLNSFDCLLHPVDYEGFGIVIAEAMACGVPVVAPCHGGVGEIVRTGGVLAATTQFCYDEEFFTRLAEGVNIVYSQHEKLSKEARAVAVEQFDIRNIAQEFIDIAAELGVRL